jgi:hypothetical protein
MGTALTYARRYALFTLVGIAGEDDLDAPDLATSQRDEPQARRSGEMNGAPVLPSANSAGFFRTGFAASVIAASVAFLVGARPRVEHDRGHALIQQAPAQLVEKLPLGRKLGELAFGPLSSDTSCNVTVEAGRHLGKSEGDCGGAK